MPLGWFHGKTVANCGLTQLRDDRSMGRSCCALPCKLWPDTTVRVTKQFLEEHPEESPLPLRGAVAGREIVASFLNWPESRVGYSHGGQP